MLSIYYKILTQGNTPVRADTGYQAQVPVCCPSYVLAHPPGFLVLLSLHSSNSWGQKYRVFKLSVYPNHIWRIYMRIMTAFLSSLIDVEVNIKELLSFPKGQRLDLLWNYNGLQKYFCGHDLML